MIYVGHCVGPCVGHCKLLIMLLFLTNWYLLNEPSWCSVGCITRDTETHPNKQALSVWQSSLIIIAVTFHIFSRSGDQAGVKQHKEHSG